MLLSSPATGLLAGIELLLEETQSPVLIKAEAGFHWQQGSYEVWYMRECQVQQGEALFQGAEGIAWIDLTDPTTSEKNKVLLYTYEGKLKEKPIEGAR